MNKLQAKEEPQSCGASLRQVSKVKVKKITRFLTVIFILRLQHRDAATDPLGDCFHLQLTEVCTGRPPSHRKQEAVLLLPLEVRLIDNLCYTCGQ